MSQQEKETKPTIIDGQIPQIKFEDLQKEKEEPQAQKFIEQNTQLANQLKKQGNNFYKQSQNNQAIQSYQKALQYSSEEQKKIRSILYSNIAICLIKQNQHRDAIDYCKKSIKYDENYVKARMNLALSYEKLEKVEQAYEQYQALEKIAPNDANVKLKLKSLEVKVNQLNQKKKEEVISGLKNIGNSVLGYFGMSLDNFKLEQGEGGGYNIGFKN